MRRTSAEPDLIVMFPNLLRRRGSRSRPSLGPPHLHYRDKPPPWRRPLTWVALITLVASALYFSVVDRSPRSPSNAVPAAESPAGSARAN